ncbi:MAG: right-handed parallel beta-helix repeat-containing protein, partial [Planctomycetota bacterium]
MMRTVGSAYAIGLLSLSIAAQPGWAIDRFVNSSGVCVGGTPCYTTIQAAIADSVPADVINVEPGTYAEDLEIGFGLDGLELVGNESDLAATTIKGVVNVDSTQFPLAVPNINILASGVVIHGFTIQGPDPVAGRYASGMVIGGDNVEVHHNAFEVTNASTLDDISQGIQTYRDGNGGAGALDGLDIHDNTFTHHGEGTAGYEAIFINHVVGPMITERGRETVRKSLDLTERTDADDNQLVAGGPGTLAPATVANNLFGGMLLRGISSERSSTVIFGNVLASSLPSGIPGAFQGINIRDYGGRDQADVTIEGNSVTGFLQGLRLGASGAGGQALTNILVSANTFDANQDGVYIAGVAGNSAAITFTCNHIINSTGSDSGVHIANNAHVDAIAFNGNMIVGNALFGINNEGIGILNAVDNFWGDASGPTHASNPGGTGDAISDNVDADPWWANPVNALVLVADSCQEDVLPGQAGHQILVELQMLNLCEPVTGFQAFVEYDETLLTYRGTLSSYTFDPFPLHIDPIDQSNDGQLELSGSVNFGGPATQGNALLAELIFDILTPGAGTEVVFRIPGDFDFPSELSFEGIPVPTNLVNTGMLTLDDDFDGDGLLECAGDCDDDNQNIPGPDDTTCDGVDDDCDGSVDEDYVSYTCGQGACEADSTCVDGQ